MVKDEIKQPIDESKKQKIVNIIFKYFNLILLILIVIFLIGSFIFLWPKYKLISDEIKLKDEALISKFNTFEKYLDNLNEYIELYNDVEAEDIEKVNSMFRVIETPEELFAEMEEMIVKRGYNLTSLTIRPENKFDFIQEKEDTKITKSKNTIDSKIGKMLISANIIGVDYNGLKNLLTAIENNLKIIDINSLNFSLGGKTVNLELTTYYLK